MVLGAQALLAQYSIIGNPIPDSNNMIPMNNSIPNIPRLQTIPPVSMPPPPPIGSIKVTRTATLSSTNKNEIINKPQLPSMPTPLSFNLPSMPPPEIISKQPDNISKYSILEIQSPELNETNNIGKPQNITTRRFGPLQNHPQSPSNPLSPPVSMPPPPSSFNGLPKMPPPPTFWH